MTEPNLSGHVLVVEAANRAHIRHGVCTHRINVAAISGNPLVIPIADLVRRCAEHDAECPQVNPEQWARNRRTPFPPADEPFLQPDYIAAPVNGPGPIALMRREGGV